MHGIETQTAMGPPGRAAAAPAHALTLNPAAARHASPGPLTPDARGWLRHCFAAPAPSLAGMLLATGMAHGCGLLTPLGYQVVFDRVFTQGVEATLLVVVIALVGLGLLEGACQGIRLRHRSAWSSAVDAQLRPGLLARMLHQPAGQAQPVAVTLTEASRLRACVCGPLCDALLDLPLLLLLHAVLLWLSPRCALVALAVAVLLLLLHRLDQPPAQAQGQHEALLREAQALAQGMAEGAAVWRGLRVGAELVRRFATLDGQGQQATAERDLGAALRRERIQTLLRLQAVLLLGVGAHEVLAGQLAGGALVACNLLTSRMAQPWMRLLAGLDALPPARRARSALDLLLRGAVLPATPGDGGRARGVRAAGSAHQPRLVFENFAPLAPLAPLASVLQPGLCGSFGQGARIALLTPCAQQRSHAFAACLGELPCQGRAFLENGPWFRAPLSTLAVGISGELRLLPGSLRSNLALQPDAADDACLHEALDVAGLTEWFGKLPAGLEELPSARWPLREPFFRCQLALARALVRQPEVLVWALAPEEARQVHARGLFERLSARRAALMLILLGGDPQWPPPGFHLHALTLADQQPAVGKGAPAVAATAGDGAVAQRQP
jgi:ATP-binding cassette, subfamily B, bacterial HlyB/CyaB